ncbi:MAG: hypothetical protein ACE5NC_10970 [Anaerolineae bacterium]
MALSDNAKATIAYSGALAVVMAYDFASVQANAAAWGPAIEALPALGPLLIQMNDLSAFVILPVFVLLIGLAVLWVWQGNSTGYTLALVLAVIAIVLNVIFGIGLATGGFVLAAGICAVNIVLGALAANAAYQGQSEPAMAAG